MQTFQIRFIPQLIVMDRHGNVISNDGGGDLRERQNSALDYWDKIS
jgi:hypothetical protein